MAPGTYASNEICGAGGEAKKTYTPAHYTARVLEKIHNSKFSRAKNGHCTHELKSEFFDGTAWNWRAADFKTASGHSSRQETACAMVEGGSNAVGAGDRVLPRFDGDVGAGGGQATAASGMADRIHPRDLPRERRGHSAGPNGGALDGAQERQDAARGGARLVPPLRPGGREPGRDLQLRQRQVSGREDLCRDGGAHRWAPVFARPHQHHPLSQGHRGPRHRLDLFGAYRRSENQDEAQPEFRGV